jgi:hypothetical protein
VAGERIDSNLDRSASRLAGIRRDHLGVEEVSFELHFASAAD